MLPVCFSLLVIVCIVACFCFRYLVCVFIVCCCLRCFAVGLAGGGYLLFVSCIAGELLV